MSAEQVPVLQHLRQLQEHQSQLTGKKVRQSGHFSSSTSHKKQGQVSNEPQDDKTEPKIIVDQSKLFMKKPSIFASKSENQNKTNIFANKKSVNLFSLTSKPNTHNTLNIFTLASSSQPLIKNQLEDDPLSQSSQGPQEVGNDQNLTQPIQKVMKYDYQSTTEKLGDFKVIRFRSGGDATKEGVMLLSLQKQKQQTSINNTVYLMLRSQVTKVIIYQAFLLQNTKVEHFMNREENIKLWAIRSKKREQKMVPEREQVKIQFQTAEESKRFEGIIVAHSTKRQE